MQYSRSRGHNSAPLRFVRRRDDITLDDDPRVLRVEMSCGHAVSSESLTTWCRDQLEKGQYRFSCPALTQGTVKCGSEWSYSEVRRAAMFSDSERDYFEKNIALLAAAEYCDFKSCPSCESYVEREDLSNLCVRCTICSSVRKRTYQFCWQCMREWRGVSLCCGYEDCVHPDVEKLAKCRTLRLSSVQNVTCPGVRACPSCGLLLEHTGSGCKNLTCKRCRVEFCFLCLKMKSACNERSGPYKICSVAPRQTEIPVWRRS